MKGEDHGDGAGQSIDPRALDPRAVDPRAVDPRAVDPRAVDPRGQDGLARQDLFGLRLIDASSVESVVEVLLAHESSPNDGNVGSLSIVVTPNVDILVSLDKDPSSRAAQVFARAQYVLPDGMPIVGASRLLGRPLSARLPGSGLFEVLWPRLVDEQRPVVVLCANTDIAERLGETHPTAQFLVPPYIDADNDEQIAIVAKELFEMVLDQPAEFVLVGLGHPKDALIMAQFHDLCRESGMCPPLCMGLGGSFSMFIGQKRRAPRWMQRLGLEWFFRFCQEPRRLFHRYFVEDLAFVGIVARERRTLNRAR